MALAIVHYFADYYRNLLVNKKIYHSNGTIENKMQTRSRLTFSLFREH